MQEKDLVDEKSQVSENVIDQSHIDKQGLEIMKEAIAGFMVFIIAPDDLEITSPNIITIKKASKIKDQGSIISISTFDRLVEATNSSKEMLIAIKKIAELCVEKQAKEIAVLGSQAAQRSMKVLADISNIKITNFPDGNQYAHLDNLVHQLSDSLKKEVKQGQKR